MIKKELRIINELGLHARASAQLVHLADRFVSQITLKYRNREADAKSILHVMMIGASHGAVLELIVSGSDEEEACCAIEELVCNRFGEDA